MGRRPLNTTKSGKYMNPTDQARKMARKKELKKNKKQRQLIRLAVLKSQDPKQIIYEMEALDEMEYNTEKTPIFREAVLQDKRKKLNTMFARVVALYEKDDPTYFNEIKRIKREYDIRRQEKINYYESVKNAKNVNLDSIPLPQNTDLLLGDSSINPLFFQNNYMMTNALFMAGSPFFNNIPLPGMSGLMTNQQHPFNTFNNSLDGVKLSIENQHPLKGILKQPSDYGVTKVIPGPPIYMPPPLSPIRDDKREDRRNFEQKHRNRERAKSFSRSRSHSRSSSGSLSRKRRNREKEKGRRKRDRRSRSPRSHSRSDRSRSPSSDDSDKQNNKNTVIRDSDEEEYEEIIAEDKSYEPEVMDSKGKKMIRFIDGSADRNGDEEKDSRSKYKMIAKNMINNTPPSKNENPMYNITNNPMAYNMYSQMNFPPYIPNIMIPPSMMQMSNPYRPPINEPLAAPPPPPSLSTGVYLPDDDVPPLPPMPKGLANLTASIGSAQIVGLPKISMDHKGSNFGNVNNEKGVKSIGERSTADGVSAKNTEAIVIEAKPQLRSLTEESLKFLPTSLRIKRNTSTKSQNMNKNQSANALGAKSASRLKSNERNQFLEMVNVHYKSDNSNMTAAMMNLQSKDDAYSAFMKEMEDLI